MDAPAHIGPSIHIKGHVSSAEPLSIAGHIDGKIEMSDHALTVTAGGRVKADITAHTIVVGGSVQGKLHAGARIVVRETATIEGDLSAPAISLADGATLHGKVETGARVAKPAAKVGTRDVETSAA
jgi:cytoskeletal protein CcmA (bactofilin family)